MEVHLEIDDDGEHQEDGEQVGEVRQVRPVESLAKSAHFVLPRGQQVEERDDRALELRACRATLTSHCTKEEQRRIISILLY